MALFGRKRQVQPQVDLKALPRHVAIIMDGNGRWARRRGMPRKAGHAAGAETFRTIATFAKKIGVPWTTVKNIVSGRNAPSYDIMLKIIDAVDWVDANYLLLGDRPSNSASANLHSIIERQNRTIESQQTTIDRLTKKMLES